VRIPQSEIEFYNVHQEGGLSSWVWMIWDNCVSNHTQKTG